jgi:hypothetical protein
MGRRASFLAFCCLCVAACGGSAKKPTAASVCATERAAAARLLGPSTRMTIADPSLDNVECLLEGRGIRVDAVAQASALAWTEYDTATVHLAQAFGSGSVHRSGELPRPVASVSGNAVWVPAQGELIATNGTQTAGGSYLTVTVTRSSAQAPASLTVAEAVGRATLAVAPRGGNPGPSQS